MCALECGLLWRSDPLQRQCVLATAEPLLQLSVFPEEDIYGQKVIADFKRGQTYPRNTAGLSKAFMNLVTDVCAAMATGRREY